VDRLIGRANEDLANGLGNLVSRVATLVHSSRAGVITPCPWPPGTSRWLAAAGGTQDGSVIPAEQDGTGQGPGPAGTARAARPAWPEDAASLLAAIGRAPGAVRAALAGFDFRTAAAAVWAIVEEANRYLDAAQPWHVARAERAGDPQAGSRLDAILGALVTACQVLAAEIWPFLPDLAAKVAAACSDSAGVLPLPRPLFPRIETRQYPATAADPAGPAREAAALPT
jgi:methionyl-tRNA synthetase